MQSRTHSILESIVKVFVGSVLGLLTQLLVFPLYHIKVELAMNIQIVAIFTLVSLIYSYAIRRLFNWWHVKQEKAKWYPKLQQKK